MVVANNEIDETKNAGKSTTISVAIGTMRGASPDGAHPGLHSKPLDAAIVLSVLATLDTVLTF